MISIIPVNGGYLKSCGFIKRLLDDGWFLVSLRVAPSVQALSQAKPGDGYAPRKDIPIGTLLSMERQADWRE